MRTLTTSIGWTTALAVLVSLVSCRGCLVPDKGFDEVTPPPAPDYGTGTHWAALADRDDEADVTPQGATDNQDDALVDVFFVHPTTYYDDATWNQPLDHPRANERTDDSVLKNQASVYNVAARVYAPRYRQATLGAFVSDDKDDAAGAMNLAYGDVREAFEYFLDNYNEGRPLVIAGHSQGSRHAIRLLSEYFSDRATRGDELLRDRLVAAYPVGSALPEQSLTETIPGIPVCETVDQTGCVVTWNTVEPGARPERYVNPWIWFPGGHRTVDDASITCVNPITWTTDGGETDLGDHLGAVRFDDSDSPAPDRNILTARCRDGFLETDLQTNEYGIGTWGESYHIVDYQLFYMDLRRNVELRVEAYLNL